MGSNSKSSFLTKFLRQDKKANSKPANENNKYFSEPAHYWIDITQPNVIPQNGLKSQEQKRKQNVKYSSEQNLSEMKKKKAAKTKSSGKKEKRHSAGLSSWFCMSGKADTIDKSSLAPQVKNENGNIGKLKKGKTNGTDIPGENLRKNGGKKIRENKNRHSAPVPEWSTSLIPVKEHQETHVPAQKTQSNKPRSDSSPGVRYRFDGTLEKPYVFPAGLTFGPEGRKLQLRRSSNTQDEKNSQNIFQSNEKIVKAEVHKSSTEDLIIEYSKKESEPDVNKFDARKAFYLKYDSNLTHVDNDQPEVRYSDLPKRDTLDGLQQENRWKPKESTVNVSTRNSRRQSRADRSKNRYSMPPKNEQFVYMGSLENLNTNNLIEQESVMAKSSFDISAKDRVYRNNSDKRDTRNRYSMPVRNTDFVYMGSFENVNQLLNLENSIGLSLSNVDSNLCVDVEECNRIPEARTIPNNKKKVVFAHNDGVRNFHSKENKSEKSDDSSDGKSMSQDKKSQSLTNLVLSTGLSVQNFDNNNTDSISNFQEAKDSENEGEEYDQFDASLLPSGRARSCAEENPFTRRAGRTSSNPGNKRSFAPPPALTVPTPSPSSTVTSFNANLNRLSFMPGNKPFNIPPPPSYTPPKEDKDFSRAHLKDTTCHRGSQTDLSTEFDSLNMEDRDPSLRLAEVRTIFAGFSARNKKSHFEATDVSPKNKTTNYNSFVQMVEPGSIISSPNPQPIRDVLNVSDSSKCSGEVFNDSQISFFNRNENTQTSRSTNISTAKENFDWEKNHVINSSPIVFLPAKFDDITKDVSQKDKSVTFLDYVHTTALHRSINFTTSTPKEKQHLHHNVSDNKPQIPQNRPVPLPRSIHNSPNLINNTDQVEFFPLKVNPRQSVAPPVPKKRHSLNYSKSLSSAGDFEKKLVLDQDPLLGDNKKINNGKLSRTQSCEPSSTLQRRHHLETETASSYKGSENKYKSSNDDHFYEDIDSGKQEHIYDVYGDISSDNYYEIGNLPQNFDKEKGQTRNLEKLLAPLQKINLEVSPGQQRRNKPRGYFKGEMTSVHTGLAYSLDELADLFAERRCHFDDDDDDNSSIADDEMSLSNEEDMEERLKQHSLRRCVSADNLLRSGSILDRSMILAKRRKRRMRERRSKSHIFTESKDLMDFSTIFNYDVTTSATKVRYNKRKTTSNERLFKHKASHTDSGHDSEIVSPCTSPDARRHIGNKGLLSYQRPFQEFDDFCALRHGTLPKKPWEIRLRNTQNQKKSRSRENLLTLAPKT